MPITPLNIFIFRLALSGLESHLPRTLKLGNLSSEDEEISSESAR